MHQAVFLKDATCAVDDNLALHVPTLRLTGQCRACPQRYWRQGLPPGRLNTALDVLRVTRDGLDTLMTFGESEPVRDRHDAVAVRTGQEPPATCSSTSIPLRAGALAVLVAQALLYWCYQETVIGGGLPDTSRLEQRSSGCPLASVVRLHRG
jgi:hypothetical protein